MALDVEPAHLEVHPHQHAETLAAVAGAAKAADRVGSRAGHPTVGER